MQPTSPDRIAVLHSTDAPGYVDLRTDAPDGPQVATAFRSGGPGAAVLGPGELTISAPAPCPAGSRRLLITPDGASAGYLEYRWQLSPVRCVIALVDDDDRGVIAWTRERRALPAALARLRLARAIPSMAVMIGQDERGSIDPVEGGHVLSWHGAERLTRTQSLLLAMAPVLGSRA